MMMIFMTHRPLFSLDNTCHRIDQKLFQGIEEETQTRNICHLVKSVSLDLNIVTILTSRLFMGERPSLFSAISHLYMCKHLQWQVFPLLPYVLHSAKESFNLCEPSSESNLRLKMREKHFWSC